MADDDNDYVIHAMPARPKYLKLVPPHRGEEPWLRRSTLETSPPTTPTRSSLHSTITPTASTPSPTQRHCANSAQFGMTRQGARQRFDCLVTH